MRAITSSLSTSERERLYTLCAQIVEEQDFLKFLQLVQKLSDVLDRKELREDDRLREICDQALRAEHDQVQPFLRQLREVLRVGRDERLDERPRQQRRLA